MFSKNKASSLEEKAGNSVHGSLSGTVANMFKVGVSVAYMSVFAWMFMPMCEMQKMGNLYPGYNTPKLEMASKRDKKVALIPISGTISSDDKAGVNSNVILTYIDEALGSGVSGFIFEIDSPGGVVLPSKDLMEKVASLEQPTVAVIRNVGASGAYWVASACDYIIADETSTVGSIGVRIDRFDISGLMKRLGVRYDPVFAGEHKTMGTPFNELRKDEREILEEMVGDLHELFISTVAENRGIEVDDLRSLATGRVFLGREAFVNNLVDNVGGRAAASDWMYGELDEGFDIEVYKQPQQKGIFGLTKIMGNAIGEGVGSVILEYTTKQP